MGSIARRRSRHTDAGRLLLLAGLLAALAGCPIHPSVPTPAFRGESTAFEHLAYDRDIPVEPARARDALLQAVEELELRVGWSQMTRFSGEAIVFAGRDRKMKVEYLPVAPDQMSESMATRLRVRSVRKDDRAAEALAKAIYDHADRDVPIEPTAAETAAR